MEGKSRTSASGKVNGGTTELEKAKSYESYFQVSLIIES